jgi:hypothetical protein
MHCSKAKATADLVRDPIVFLQRRRGFMLGAVAPMVGPRARKGNRRFFAARDVGMSGCSFCDRINPRREIVIQSAAIWL